MAFSRRLERMLLATGVLFCFLSVGAVVYRSIGSRIAVRSFEAQKQAGNLRTGPNNVKEDSLSVDRRLWSQNRVVAYVQSLTARFGLPLAILRVPKLNIEAPVFEGTDELVLNRGVGRVTGTAAIGQPGNVGIAGHRDGFFRSLKDITVGDVLTLTTERETFTYAVDRITIVSPSDVHVLAEASTPVVTLVTCYPFYFIGHAPQRYIVRCSRRENGKSSISEDSRPNGAPKSGG